MEEIDLPAGKETSLTATLARVVDTPEAVSGDFHLHSIWSIDSRVDEQQRILSVAAEGVDWGTGEWHRVRLERDVEEGTTKVYFDDMHTPTLVAKNETLTWGLVGFGSFDDTGRFANVKIWAPEDSEPLPDNGEPFPPPG